MKLDPTHSHHDRKCKVLLKNPLRFTRQCVADACGLTIGQVNYRAGKWGLTADMKERRGQTGRAREELLRVEKDLLRLHLLRDEMITAFKRKPRHARS